MKDALSEAKTLAAAIAAQYKPEKIVLFGSVARGNYNDASDIDLLIIKDTDIKRPYRIKHVLEAIRGIPRHFDFDPKVYTRQEIENRLRMGDDFVKNMIDEGLTLYE